MILASVTPQRRFLVALRWFTRTALPANYAVRLINLADTRVIDAPVSPKIDDAIVNILRSTREADAIIVHIHGI